MTNLEIMLTLLLSLSIVSNMWVLNINKQQKQKHEVFKVEVTEKIKRADLNLKALENAVVQLPKKCYSDL